MLTAAFADRRPRSLRTELVAGKRRDAHQFQRTLPDHPTRVIAVGLATDVACCLWATVKASNGEAWAYPVAPDFV